MKRKRVDDNLRDALSLYREQMKALSFKSTSTYCTLIRKIQEELDNKKLIEDYLLPQIKKENPISEVLVEFNKTFNNSSIGNYKKGDCQSALISFSKFILGYYNANLHIFSQIIYILLCFSVILHFCF